MNPDTLADKTMAISHWKRPCGVTGWRLHCGLRGSKLMQNKRFSLALRGFAIALSPAMLS